MAVVATTGAIGSRAVVPQPEVFRPEDFGAVGDGRQNDTGAFARLAEAVNRRGGGRIILRRATYIVGGQQRATDPERRFLYQPAPIMRFEACRQALSIEGNGARLRTAPALRYGSFDRQSGQPLMRRIGFEEGVLASPYVAMIEIARCRAPVSVAQVELDGAADTLVVGGAWGDHGWQVPGSGLVLTDNSGGEILEDIHTHDHPLDGLIIDGAPSATAAGHVTRLRAGHNGRQGCSIIGGNGYTFGDCRFEGSGRGRIASAPGAGCDIEAENGKTVRAITFEACMFVDNAGPGLLVETGDIAAVAVRSCQLTGTTAWAAWPNKPMIRFEDCLFVGAISNCFGGSVEEATHFARCTFRDDPAFAPGGQVFLNGRDGVIADLSSRLNVRFDECRFNLTHAARLPWSTGAIYANCLMTQRAATRAYPRGTYLGRNVVNGNVAIENSRILGQTIVNGRAAPRTA